jgi:hypothetical protein
VLAASFALSAAALTVDSALAPALVLAARAKTRGCDWRRAAREKTREERESDIVRKLCWEELRAEVKRASSSGEAGCLLTIQTRKTSNNQSEMRDLDGQEQDPTIQIG